MTLWSGFYPFLIAFLIPQFVKLCWGLMGNGSYKLKFRNGEVKKYCRAREPGNWWIRTMHNN
jgi:hypothetical protein